MFVLVLQNKSVPKKMFLVHVINSYRDTSVPQNVVRLLTPDIKEAIKSIRDRELIDDPFSESAILYELKVGQTLTRDDFVFFVGSESPRTARHPVRMSAEYSWEKDGYKIRERWYCPTCWKPILTVVADLNDHNPPACPYCKS